MVYSIVLHLMQYALYKYHFNYRFKKWHSDFWQTIHGKGHSFDVWNTASFMLRQLKNVGSKPFENVL